MKVTRDLLEELERYLVTNVARICSLSPDEAARSISIRVEDKRGAENFSSVSQFNTTKFPDSTKCVQLEVDTHIYADGTQLNLQIKFSRGRMMSKLSIRCKSSSASARESVVGLKDGIFRVFEPSKTWHWICNPAPEIWGVLIAAWIVLFFVVWDLIKYPVVRDGVAFGIIALFICMAGLRYLRPYTVFDSRSSEWSDKLFWNLLWGLLVSGMLIPFVRKCAFGF